MKQSSLSLGTKEAILGSILGDGSLRIQKGYKNARFAFRHSVRQKDYFFWKVKLLEEISSERSFWMQEPDGKGGKKLRFQSLALEELTKFYHLTHERGKLNIRRKWLNMLTPFSLAIWWLDDGSIIANGRKGVICTDPFSYEEQKILARYLLVVWKVKVHIGKVKVIYEGEVHEYYRLWIRSTDELKKFLRIVLPFVQVPSMLQKVILLYKDSQLQQRWISEISSLTGFSEDEVEKHLQEKKGRWKRFRE